MLFSYKFEKLLKSSFFTGHLWWLLLYFNNFSFLCSMKSFIKNKCQKLQWNLISMKTKLSKINLTKMFYHRTFFSLNFLKKKRITNFVLCFKRYLIIFQTKTKTQRSSGINSKRWCYFNYICGKAGNVKLKEIEENKAR